MSRSERWIFETAKPEAQWDPFLGRAENLLKSSFPIDLTEQRLASKGSKELREMFTRTETRSYVGPPTDLIRRYVRDKLGEVIAEMQIAEPTPESMKTIDGELKALEDVQFRGDFAALYAVVQKDIEESFDSLEVSRKFAATFQEILRGIADPDVDIQNIVERVVSYKTHWRTMDLESLDGIFLDLSELSTFFFRLYHPDLGRSSVLTQKLLQQNEVSDGDEWKEEKPIQPKTEPTSEIYQNNKANLLGALNGIERQLSIYILLRETKFKKRKFFGRNR